MFGDAEGKLTDGDQEMDDFEEGLAVGVIKTLEIGEPEGTSAERKFRKNCKGRQS